MTGGAGVIKLAAERVVTTRTHPQSGFTVVEILVVILILVIVTTLAGIGLIHAMDKARQRDTMADMRRLATAIDLYMAEHRGPPPAEDLAELVELLGADHRPALPQRDQWGHAFRYTYEDSGGYSIESPGKGGVFGSDIALSTRFDFELDIVMIDGGFVASPE